MRSFFGVPGRGIDGVACRDRDIPEIRPHESLVRVRACSLNWREILVLRGTYPLPLAPELVIGCDAAGDVVEVGSDVTSVSVGDRVMPSVFPRWLDGPFAFDLADQLGGSRDGVLSEYLVIDAASLVMVPPHLSYEQAACLPCAGVTAWNALTGGCGLRVGDSVLTQGTGAVSLMATQLAVAAGARVVGTSSSAKRERLVALGVAAALDYRAPGWPAEVVVATGGGADHVVEIAGTLAASLTATAVGGELAAVGGVDAQAAATPIDFATLRARLVHVRPVAIGSRAQFAELARAVAATRIEPVIERSRSTKPSRHSATTRRTGRSARWWSRYEDVPTGRIWTPRDVPAYEPRSIRRDAAPQPGRRRNALTNAEKLSYVS